MRPWLGGDREGRVYTAHYGGFIVTAREESRTERPALKGVQKGKAEYVYIELDSGVLSRSVGGFLRVFLSWIFADTFGTGCLFCLETVLTENL